MTGTFSYAPEMLQAIAEQARRRRTFCILFCTPFWIAGGFTLFAGDSATALIGMALALGATGIVLGFEWSLRKFEARTLRLGDSFLEYDGDRTLTQWGTGRRAIAQIDLTAPFRVHQPFGNVCGNAIYHVFQPPNAATPSLVFSSSINGGERLVRELLREDEWPPGSNSC